MEPNADSRGQRKVLGLLVLGYAALYFCRSNVDAALPLLKESFGYDDGDVGSITSASIATYAVGKVLLGALGDRLGGKATLLLAAFGSIAATAAFGVEGGLIGFVVCAGANRFFQAGGWAGLVHVASRWFPSRRYGAVMGILSLSYELGAVSTFLLCAGLNEAFGWHALFIVNPLLLAGAAVMVLLFLKGKPDLPVYAVDAAPKKEEPRESFFVVFPWLAAKPAFWVVVVLSMLLTFIRTTFAAWTAVYLAHLTRLADPSSTASWAIAKAAIFPAAGMIAAPLFGRLSDCSGAGRRAPLMALSLAGLVALVLVLAHAGVTDALSAMALIGVSGLFLLGPYSMMAGALCLDVAGKRGTATAAGIIDGAGYLAATVAGFGIGNIAKGAGGWSLAWDVVAGAAFAAFLVSVGWALVSRRRPAAAPAGA